MLQAQEKFYAVSHGRSKGNTVERINAALAAPILYGAPYSVQIKENELRGTPYSGRKKEIYRLRSPPSLAV